MSDSHLDLEWTVAGALSLPYAEPQHTVRAGFRMTVFELADSDGNPVGRVDTGGGVGNIYVTMEWGDKKAVISTVDLLAAWLDTFNPESAAGVRALHQPRGGITVVPYPPDE